MWVHATPSIAFRFSPKAKVIEMATGGNVPELGGYDYEFTSKVPEDWQCPVCHLTLKDPVQIVGCGHRLCTICMEFLLRNPAPICPVDRQPMSREKIFPDAACHRKILDLTVKCSHSGCSWTGALRAVEEHQSECLFKVIKCPNSGCAKMLSKREMKTHETSECSWRKVNCEYCHESVIMTQKQKHFEICPKFPVMCANKCGLRDVAREKLEVHVRDECPATEVQCEYKKLGCEAVFPRSDAKSHLQTEIESHLNLALRGLEAIQHQLHELVAVVKNQSKQIERQSEQIERLISEEKDQSQQTERQSQQIEKLLPNDNEQSQQMSKLKIDQISLTPFEWKIPNFEALFLTSSSEKQSIVCEPFCLFERGYKFLLQIVIARPLSPRFLRVFIKVVPGENDDFLSWPCKEKVFVTLVHQDLPLDNRKNISHVVDFEIGKEPCSRPLRNDYHDYRSSLALSRQELRSYITNDTILIRVNRE